MFGRIVRIATEKVILYLLSSKFVQIHSYALGLAQLRNSI